MPLDARWNMEHGDVWIVLDGAVNTKHLSGADPAKIARHVKAREPYQAGFLERSSRGEFRWTACSFPTEAWAQGAGMSLSQFEDLVYGAAFLEQTPEAYERLLLDALIGDPTLFIRTDEVRFAWHIVDPILTAWEEDRAPLVSYPAGTWGPKEADDLLAGNGREWRKP